MLRSPVRASIPREGQVERYYVRMCARIDDAGVFAIFECGVTDLPVSLAGRRRRWVMTEFEGQVLADLSVLKSQMGSVDGNRSAGAADANRSAGGAS